MTIGTISSILNILFEVWFIYYTLIKIKNIDTKKRRLFTSVLIGYMLASMLIGFLYKNQIYMLVMMTTFIYLFCKLLYKKKIQILDVFTIYYVVGSIYLTAMIVQICLGYNIISLLVSRVVLLFIVIFISKYYKKIYKICVENWNRGINHKIKSITLRNILIIGMNFTIFLLNCYLLNYLISKL